MSAPLKIESGSGLIEYLRGSAFVGLCLGYVQRGLFQLTLQLAASGNNPATEFGRRTTRAAAMFRGGVVRRRGAEAQGIK